MAPAIVLIEIPKASLIWVADNPINLPAMGTTPKTGKVIVPSQPRLKSHPLAASTRLTVSWPTSAVVRNSLPLTLYTSLNVKAVGMVVSP